MDAEGVSLPLIHEHLMMPWNDLRKGDCCGKLEAISDGYYCESCEYFVHKRCSDKASEGVLLQLPLIHKHLMMPWNDLRKGDCCGRFESTSDGYYCRSCNFFVHKKCGDEKAEFIEHPSHPDHTLRLLHKPGNLICNLCGRVIVNLSYRCETCDVDVHLHCAKYPPPEFIDVSKTHRHKLTLVKKWTEFECDAKCGKTGNGFPYKCDECDLAFHVDCVWHSESELEYPAEVSHPDHSLHPLKLLTGQPPEYSDGKCRLCGREIDTWFYHCSSCNFTLDMRCVLHPPPKSLLDLKTHDHQLTLLPRLFSFTCNACGLHGDRSPYMCVQCDFMIHQNCLGLPRIININRHDHRVSLTSLLGVVNSVCGVCRKKVDWTCGGYSCQKCLGYVVHSKCATRIDVWNGNELEGVPEEEEDTEPFVVIDDNTIQHFSHKEHYLRLHVSDILYEENRRCNACTHPICLKSFYGCVDCDFLLHKKCAESPTKKPHMLHNERLALVTSATDFFSCNACRRISNGFRYQHGYKNLDVLCGSISEPFVHPSHPHHPLYYISPHKFELCSVCNKRVSYVLSCLEDDCGFMLGFECATLPQVVKHRVDDHPLSLCYGDKKASGKYWCDICEKETNPETWFYTCKDHRASLHIKCVVGDFSGLMPRSAVYIWDRLFEVVLNNSITRPICGECESRCIYPIILKLLGTSDTFFCSFECIRSLHWRSIQINLPNQKV